ncbi:hypothetical protein Btru_045878 [Bulinus truncatus]|nr:hypothetical protein Btru_045878 [Bulinus truncatus]
MREIGLSLLFLWITLVQFGYCSYADILWGQCYSFCLSRSEIQQKVTDGEIDSDQVIQACKKHQICKWCLFACDRPVTNYENHSDCLNDCNHPRNKQNIRAHTACTDSCNVISSLLQKKYGTCPKTDALEASSNNCTSGCDKDMHCAVIEKCCNNSCASVCSRPLEYKDIPQMPYNLTFQEKNDGGLLIKWQPPLNNLDVRRVLYILRWWCPYSLAAQFKFTTKPQVKLKGNPVIQPSSVCSYMLAAINIHGSEGFTAPQKYSKKLLKPSPPQSLVYVSSKEQGQTVDMTIKWQPPYYTDELDVTNYKISWSDGLPRGRSNYMRLHMHRKTIRGDRNSFTIQKLNPCTVYFVQVQAVVRWDNMAVSGHPASVYMEACIGPQPASDEIEYVPSADPEKTLYIFNLTVHEVEFRNSDLTVNVTWSSLPGANVKHYKVFWKLDVCEGESQHRKTRDRLQNENITQVKYFTLHNLLSDCVYELKIHAVNYTGTLDEGRKEIFRTPPCLTTKGMIANVSCPEGVIPPSPPEFLEIVHKKMSCMCQAVIKWQKTADPDHRNRHYIVIWGQSLPPTSDNHGMTSVIYNSLPFKITVPKEENRACLTYLERSKHYTVQVISHTSKSKSSPAIHHFMTPENMSPCYGISNKDERVTDYLTESEIQIQDSMFNTTTDGLAHHSNNTSCLKVSSALLGLFLLIFALL